MASQFRPLVGYLFISLILHQMYHVPKRGSFLIISAFRIQVFFNLWYTHSHTSDPRPRPPRKSGYSPVSSSSPFSPSSIPSTLLVNSLVTVHTTLLSSYIPQATPSSFNMLAELEAIWHKRDEAAQQNEAPVAGSVEGQSVPVKMETLVGKVVQLKLQLYWRQQPWKECMLVMSLECLDLPSKQQTAVTSPVIILFVHVCANVCMCMYVCVCSVH